MKQNIIQYRLYADGSVVEEGFNVPVEVVS